MAVELTERQKKRKQYYERLVTARKTVDLGKACELAARLTDNRKLRLALLESAKRLEGQTLLLTTE